ncbi:MAG: hypothetical protein AB7E61_02425 [Acholeplasmataceae bacterium]
MKDKTKEWLFYNFGYLGAFFVSIAYGIWGLITLEETGKTALQIIGDIGIAIAIGFLLVTLLKIQGLIKGRQNADFIQVMRDFILALTNAVPFFKYLFRYITMQNNQAYIIVRTSILSKRGMKYNDYFDDEGRFIGSYEKIESDDSNDVKSLKIAKNKAITQCMNLSITTLSPNDITADNGKPLDPLYLGETQESWLMRTSISGLLITVLMALLFGWFAPDFIEGFDYGSLIWKVIQLVSFTISGLIQMYLAWLFITGPFKNRFIKKTNHLDDLRILGGKWDLEEQVKGGENDGDIPRDLQSTEESSD